MSVGHTNARAGSLGRLFGGFKLLAKPMQTGTCSAFFWGGEVLLDTASLACAGVSSEKEVRG